MENNSLELIKIWVEIIDLYLKKDESFKYEKFSDISMVWENDDITYLIDISHSYNGMYVQFSKTQYFKLDYKIIFEFEITNKLTEYEFQSLMNILDK